MEHKIIKLAGGAFGWGWSRNDGCVDVASASPSGDLKTSVQTMAGTLPKAALWETFLLPSFVKGE